MSVIKTGRLVLAAQPQLGIPALYVHDLTGTPDAVRLLGKPPSIHPLTPRILPRLRQFSPEIASKLVEKDNTVKQIPFKLITANQVWVPTDIQSFVALSYCWHGDDWEVPSRFNDHQPHWDFPLSPAFINAILSQCIVDSGTTLHLAIWLDQICINQQDSEEKFHAIANLDSIYRNAFAVNILLEDIDISYEEESALDQLYAKEHEYGLHESFHITGFDVHENFSNCLDASSGKTLVGVLWKIFESRWFTRAWCRHEFMLNSNAIFTVIGRRRSSITMTRQTFSRLHSELADSGVDLDRLVLNPMFQDFSFGIHEWNDDYTTGGCLFELFVQLQYLDSSYERDIISIALNVSGIGLSFNGDITRQRECRYVLAMIALGAGDVSVIGSEGLPMYRMHWPGHQPLLYWPRGKYESSWSDATTYSMPKICNDARIWHVSPERISLDISFLHSQPSLPQAKFRESATELLSVVWTTDGIEDESMKKIYISILSCAFAFGLSWIDMASGYLIEFLEDMRDDQSFLSVIARHYFGNENSIPTELITSLSRITQFMHLLASCHTVFANLGETTPLVMRLNTAGTGWAILLVPKHLAREVSGGKYRIAVPVALNTASALSIRRLWILEDAKEDAKTGEPALALVGRGFFIGDRDLNVEQHDKISYVQHISVVGQWQDDNVYSEDDSSFEERDI